MKKSRILAIITDVLYLIPVVLAFIFSNSLKATANAGASGNEKLGEAIGIALTSAIAMVLYIVVLFYLVIVAMPALSKTVQIFVPRRFLSNICIVFDCITFVIHALLTVTAILNNNGTESIIIFGGFTLISIAAFVLNIITKKAIDDDEMDEFFDELYSQSESN